MGLQLGLLMGITMMVVSHIGHKLGYGTPITMVKYLVTTVVTRTAPPGTIPQIKFTPCHESEVGSLVSTKIWLFSGSMLIWGMVSSASYEIP